MIRGYTEWLFLEVLPIMKRSQSFLKCQIQRDEEKMNSQRHQPLPIVLPLSPLPSLSTPPSPFPFCFFFFLILYFLYFFVVVLLRILLLAFRNSCYLMIYHRQKQEANFFLFLLDMYVSFTVRISTNKYHFNCEEIYFYEMQLN